MLSASNLSIGHDHGKILIRDINFQCQKGEFIILLGVNGIGKSTLLRTICGLTVPIHGAINYGGRNLFDLGPSDRAKIISGVFTGKDFDPFITVREFVSLGRFPYTNWLGTMTEEDESKIMSSMTTLELMHLADKKVLQISDGERQKSIIAKAIAQDTPVIVMDEPTAFLDYKNKAELLSTIRQLSNELGKIIILSTHDIAASLPFSDRVFMITESGKFLQTDNSGVEQDKLKMMMETK